jgi:hypothetical protein
VLLIIVGGVIVGGVGLAALYDYVSRRHGRKNSISASGPMSPNIDPMDFDEEYRR